MCFFPFTNTAINSIAYKKGLTTFKCGCCPECLSDKARYWSLRCCAEAQTNIGCMITLTYDDYKLDKYGRKTNIEKPVDNTLHVDKLDCQLFFKRLRKHFKGLTIKYLLTAEYGKRTHRAHYHAILFGVDFVDKIKYKRSKRGNLIYKSPTLEKIWGHGICTIDAVNINGAVARYCTKYCAKDTRCDDTFMLFSHGIGDKWLCDNFNGISYIIDGREYSIPKQIWNWYTLKTFKNNYIFNRYGATYCYRDCKYYEKRLNRHNKLIVFLASFNCNSSLCAIPEIVAVQQADLNAKQRLIFRNFRDSLPKYKKYLEYWKRKAEQLSISRLSIFNRIRMLPDDKYFTYKQKALACLNARKYDLYSADNIRSYNAENFNLPPRYISKARLEKAREKICRLHPCHKTANDTTSPFDDLYVKHFVCDKLPDSWFPKPLQLSFL